MPVSLSVWRVRIGTYLRKYRHDPKKEAEQSKESDNANSENLSSNGCSLVENGKAVNTSFQQPPSADDEDQKTAHTVSPSNTSGSKGDLHYQTPSTSVISGCDTTNGSSCDFRSPGNNTQHGFLCANDCTLQARSTGSTEKQSTPFPDPSDTKVPKPCDVDELDMRHITIHRVSPAKFCTSTQISKKNQPNGTSDSYSQETRAIIGAQDDGKHDEKETSNTIPSCIEGQSSPSSELNTCKSSNAEHSSSCTRSPGATMPVSLSLWRVTIGTFMRRKQKAYDSFYYLMNYVYGLELMAKKAAQHSRENDRGNRHNSSFNGYSSGENGKTDYASCRQPPPSNDVDTNPSQTESSSDREVKSSKVKACSQINYAVDIGSSCHDKSPDQIAQDMSMSTEDHTLSTCSTCSTEQEFIPAPQPTTACDVNDELDMRYITIHSVSPVNCNSTQRSKPDQPDGTSESYSQVAEHHETPIFPGNISYSLSEEADEIKGKYNAVVTTVLLLMSVDVEPNPDPDTPIFPGNISYSLSEKADEMKGKYKAVVTTVLLLMSGDVEPNPGPDTNPGNLTELELSLLADGMDPSDFMKVGLTLGFTEAQLSRFKEDNIGNIMHATYKILVEWLKTVRHQEAREMLSNKLKDINLKQLADSVQKGQVGDHILSLTEAELQRVIIEVKEYYALHHCLIQADPLNSSLLFQLGRIFTNLTLIGEDKGTKASILYADLLKTKVNGILPKRLLIEGEGGVGKTTLCAKIVWDWIHGTCYQDFKLVLLVLLRKVRDKTIGEIIKDYLPDDNMVTAMQLNKYVFLHQKDVLLVLDGLDELAGDLNSSHQIALIILNRLFKSGKVLITSRRWKSDEIRKITELRKLYAFIAVEGFSYQNISSYVTKFFHPDTTPAEELTQFISNNDVIRENMAPYPIYTAMLCIMWKEFDEACRVAMLQLQTFSQLIDEMVQFLVDHYLSKLRLTSKDKEWHVQRAGIRLHLVNIGCLAFQGLKERRLVFTEQEFKSWPGCVNTGCQVGVLTKQEPFLHSRQRRYHTHPADLYVQFPHKLFQEYLSGIYLASLYTSNRSEYDRLIKDIIGKTREFTKLLYFTSAQLKEVGLDIVSHLIASKDISTPTFQMKYQRIDDDFIVDVAYESQDQTVAKAVADHLSTTSNKALKISRGMQVHTVSGHIFILNHRKVENLFIEQPCGRTASEDLAEFICSSHTLRTVKIIMPECQENMHDVFYTVLACHATNSKIETLHLDVDLSESPLASRHLAQFICKINHLKSLLLIGQYHGDFYSTSLSMAKDSFPQISNGCFSFNEEQQLNLESFIQSLTAFARKFEPGATSSTQGDGDGGTPSSSGKSPGQKGADVVETDTDHIKQALENGEALCHRSRIMVIGPAGVGKTSFIRRLTGQSFNSDEQSTKGTEENIVTNNAVSRWKIVSDTHKSAEDVLAESIASSKPRTLQEVSKGEETKDFAESTDSGRGDIHQAGNSSDGRVQEETIRSRDKGAEPMGSAQSARKPSTSYEKSNDKGNEVSSLKHIQVSETDEREERTAGNKQSVNGNGETDKCVMPENEDDGYAKSPPTKNNKFEKRVRDLTGKVTKVASSVPDTVYSIWDFGGQEIYYITHPLFFSWRALYILVIPLHLKLSDAAPRKENTELIGSAVTTSRTILDLIHFWLMSVYTHAVPGDQNSGDNPQVLLIGTFAGEGDNRISKEEVKSKENELKKLIKSQPYEEQVNLTIFEFDNLHAQRKEVKEVQDRIDAFIKEAPYMKVPIPVKWYSFLCEIEDSGKDTWTVKEALSEMNKSWGITEEDELQKILKFFHDIGNIIYHQGCELIILKPQFLNSIVSDIIRVIDNESMTGEMKKHYMELFRNGILHIEIIQAVWEKHKGEDAQLDDIINMMIMFDLICEIPHGNDGERSRNDGKERKHERRFFVPCRSSPSTEEKEKYPRGDKIDFIIDFHHFLPDGFLHRLYVRMAKWSMEKQMFFKPTFHCRQMDFLIDHDHRVVMDRNSNQIEVTIYAIAPECTRRKSNRLNPVVSLNEDIIRHLHDTLDDLKVRWARRVEYTIGIHCVQCKKRGDKELIPLRNILNKKENIATCNNDCPMDVTHILKAFNKLPEDNNFASGHFAQRGGELCVEYYGFRLFVPSGALEKEEKICLRVLTEIPDDIIHQFQDDDVVVSYGFKLYPSGLTFKKPAKLIIPHCAVVTTPNNIQTTLYPLDKSGKNKQTLGLSNMFCSVQDNWIEVYISHFCGGTPTLKWSKDETNIQGISLSYLPFLPIFMPSNRKPILQVRFVQILTQRRSKLERLHKLDGTQFQPVKDDDDELFLQKKDLSVSCRLVESVAESVEQQSIPYSTMATKNKHTLYFSLDMTNMPDETQVKLDVQRTDEHTETILFNTRFDERCSPGSDSHPIPFNAQLGAEDAGRVCGNNVIYQQYNTYNNGTCTAGVAASRALENTLDESEMSRPPRKKKGKHESPR